mgnify:CR=1 FL=1
MRAIFAFVIVAACLSFASAGDVVCAASDAEKSLPIFFDVADVAVWCVLAFSIAMSRVCCVTAEPVSRVLRQHRRCGYQGHVHQILRPLVRSLQEDDRHLGGVGHSGQGQGQRGRG